MEHNVQKGDSWTIFVIELCFLKNQGFILVIISDIEDWNLFKMLYD